VRNGKYVKSSIGPEHIDLNEYVYLWLLRIVVIEYYDSLNNRVT